MKKILHILPCLEYGGTEAFIINHYRRIDRDALQFDFLVFAENDWPHIAEIHQLGGKVFFATQPSLLHFGRFFNAFRNAIEAGGPYAAIHCHANAGNAVPLVCGALCAIASRISHSHAVNNVSSGVLRKGLFYFRRLLINMFATQYLSCSNEAGVSLYGENVFKKKGQVIGNGISVEGFIKPNPPKVDMLRQELHLEKETNIVMGNISRFDENKNQQFIVELFEIFLKSNPNAVLLLGGVDGGKLRQIKTYVKDHRLQDNVQFIGKRSDMEECLKLIDIYVFPSIQEGLGIALLEAQAAGCLCVASTGVPKATDMGLGTAFYLDLSKGPEYWAEFVNEQVKMRADPTEAEIRTAFKSKAFDISETTKRLVKCYEETKG